MNMQIIDSINSDSLLTDLRRNFSHDIYLVGGSVRDSLLGKLTFDRDLIVCGIDVRVFSEKLADFFNATFVTLDALNNIYRVVMPDKINYFDITAPIENSLYKDLARRDLTINSIAVNLKTLDVIDPFNGIDDIKNCCLREISEQNFIDDPLRILRVYRFMSCLGFKISSTLESIIKKYNNLVILPAVERINYELLKLFSGMNAYDSILALDNVGILEMFFPFVSELKQVPPNSHHHLNLFFHSLETVKQLDLYYKSSSSFIKSHLNSIDFGSVSRFAHLKLAAFMHDIGKFSTWTIEDISGRHRFIKHDDVGAKLAIEYLKNLNFSNKQVDYISSMIKNHIYPSHVISSPDLNEKIMMRFVRKMDINSIDIILLAMADRLSARGPAITDKIVSDNISGLDNLLNFYLSVRDNLEPLPKLLSGDEIMHLLNIKPSPLLGNIIAKLHDAQLNGDVMSKEHAVDFVMQFKNI